MGFDKCRQYSVLMPLWYKEKLDFLMMSIESMLTQTIPPSEIILITDSDLPKEMILLIEELQTQYYKVPILVKQNNTLFGKGLGAILAYGVTCCNYPIIARMDTDDISFPERCEKELEILNAIPHIAIVGGGIGKFSLTTQIVEGVRIPPKNGKTLRQYSKFRSPFNHPTVMFRKSIILEVGNYAPLKEGEDYELWYRILKNGYEGYNIQYPVLYYRAGVDMLKRRKNKQFFMQSLNLIKTMYNDRYINYLERIVATLLQYIRYYAPLQINKLIYKHVRT